MVYIDTENFNGVYYWRRQSLALLPTLINQSLIVYIVNLFKIPYTDAWVNKRTKAIF